MVGALAEGKMNNVLFNNNSVIHHNFPPRRPRVYRHRPSQLCDTFTDEEIRNRYRFRRNSIAYICDVVRQDLQRRTQRNHALSVETQVLASLRFLASGCFNQVDADILGIDKSSVCRVLNCFCRALVAKQNDFVKFPFTDAKNYDCDPVDPTQDSTDGKVVRDHIANTFF